jgi:hypothetical protein
MKNLIRFGVYSLMIVGGVVLALNHKNFLKHIFKSVSGG